VQVDVDFIFVPQTGQKAPADSAPQLGHFIKSTSYVMGGKGFVL